MKAYNGVEKFLNSREVKRGEIDWLNVDDHDYKPVYREEWYIKKRQTLMLLYATVGELHKSKIAFRQGILF